jgi:predicted membrane channel-forming protein YqfA (hemolysin III family)
MHPVTTDLHSESVNIYTYLFPALIIVLGQNNVYGQITRRFPEATSTDRLIFNFNIVAAFSHCAPIFHLSHFYESLLRYFGAVPAHRLRWHPATYPEQCHLRDLR